VGSVCRVKISQYGHLPALPHPNLHAVSADDHRLNHFIILDGLCNWGQKELSVYTQSQAVIIMRTNLRVPWCYGRVFPEWRTRLQGRTEIVVERTFSNSPSFGCFLKSSLGRRRFKYGACKCMRGRWLYLLHF